MPDPEASAPPSADGELAAYPKRGATIYAVEGAILGVVSLGWMLIRLQLSSTCLADEVVLVSFFVSGLVNLLACTLVSDHDLSQGAHFSLCLSLWGLYAYLLLESLLTTGSTAVGSDPYARVFFGSMQFFQVAAGVSCALVSLHALLAAGAISRRLWRQTLWVDGLVILLTGVQAALCGNVVIAIFDVIGLVFLALPLVPQLEGVVETLWWRLFHLFFTVATGIVTLGVAWASRTTGVGLPVFLACLVLLFLVRLLQPLPPIDYASVSHLPSAPPASEVLVVAPPPPPPPAAPHLRPPPSTPPAFLFQPPAPPQGQRASLAPDALLFGRVSRQPFGTRMNKKTL